MEIVLQINVFTSIYRTVMQIVIQTNVSLQFIIQYGNRPSDEYCASIYRTVIEIVLQTNVALQFIVQYWKSSFRGMLRFNL
jgi:hypothetical protein